MAAISTDPTTTGYVPVNQVFGRGATAQTASNNLNTDVNQKHGTAGLELKVFHVTGIDDGETVTVEFPVVAAAFQAEDASDDIVACWVANGSATNSRARLPSVITFETGASAAAGWLWLLCRS